MGMKPGKTAGMDDGQRNKDAKGFSTSVGMVTGGMSQDPEEMSAPEVGESNNDNPQNVNKG
jgi:hypothetical protein